MSPMNPRLLRPTSSSLDPDAAVYLNAVAQADGEQLEPAVRKAINDFVRGCKQDGIWSAIKASCILMGARTLSGALTPLVGPAPTNNGPFVSGDYNRITGLKGNGTSKRLNLTSLSGMELDDHSQSVLVTENGSSLRWVAGFDGNTNLSSAGLANTMRFRSSNTSGESVTGSTPMSFAGLSRAGSASFQRRLGTGGATVSNASSSGAFTSFGVFVRAGVGSSLFDGRIGFYHAGANLNIALLGSRVLELESAISAAIP